MSLLVTELNQIIDKIGVIAPTERQLFSFFEDISMDLTSQYGVGTKNNLQILSSPTGAMRAWCSFILGKRSKLDVCIALMGYGLDKELPRPEALDVCDGFFILADADKPESDKLISLKWGDEARAKPCIFSPVSEKSKDTKAPPNLRSKALYLWAERTFDKVLFVNHKDKVLTDGLEWVLSF